MNRLVILEPRLDVEAHAVPGGVVHPGERLVEMLRLEMTNESLAEVTLDSLLVENVTVGNGDVPESDVNFGTLYLYREGSGSGMKDVDTDDESAVSVNNASGAVGDSQPDAEDVPGGDAVLGRPFSAGDSLVAVAVLGGGAATFRPAAGLEHAAGAGVFYYVMADIDSFYASDGDSLDLAIPWAGAISVTGDVRVAMDGVPLNSEGWSVVDGMMRCQMEVVEGSVTDTLYMGIGDDLVLEVVVPGNGYAPDVLTGLSVRNYVYWVSLQYLDQQSQELT